MALDSFHFYLSALKFDTLCNDYGIESEFGPELPGPNETIRDFPEGKIGWFSGKEFPRDFVVDGIDGDMDFIKVPNPFDVVCAEKNLFENERPILEQTADVVTPPSDQIVNLGPVPLDHAPAGESASKKGKSVGESSSNVAVAGESASKAGDAFPTQLSHDLPPVNVFKAGEFIHIFLY
ncbi:hypothetical protein Tco_0657013 [Tanacetum coccineum]|uniref:Uncharacterized protein n=1 Tax=Tanacetum coccineum TaxID=301880 RepID=A0ABQ4XAD9_9ASTR